MAPTLLDFLQAVLPSTGNVYFMGVPAQTKDGRPFVKHQHFRTIYDLALSSRAEILNSPHKTYYYALASYIEPPHYDRETKRYHTKRDHPNVSHLCSLWADLDCRGKTESEYKSKSEAIKAIVDLVAASKLPAPSFIVDSGGGLHLYWVGDRDLPRDLWQPIAEGFKHYLLGLGVKLDRAVTADASRILRTPTSFNTKDPANPRPVTILKHAGTVYPWAALTFALPKAVTQKREARVQRASVRNDLAAPKPIIQGCRQIAAQYAVRGAGVSEPLWFVTAGLMARVDKGQALYHVLSEGHVGYNAAATDRKYSKAEDSWKNDGIFSTCKTFFDRNPDGCAHCIFKDKIHTPLDLGWDLVNQPPMRWRQSSDGIHILLPDDDGDPQWIKLTPLRFRAAEWYIDDKGNRIFAPLIVNHGNERRARINITILQHSSLSAVSTHLHSQAIEVCVGRDRLMGEFLTTWADLLQHSRGASKLGDVLGWDTNKSAFTFPHLVVHPKGNTTPTIRPDKGRSAHLYLPNGAFADWKAAADIVTAPGGDLALQTLLAASFAAPLLTFTPADGFTFVVRSDESGVGKTTVLQLAQAVWGDPMAVAYKDDTMNSVMNRVGNAPNMPFCWDEARLDTLKARETMQQTIFSLQHGREKTRLSDNIQQREPHSWRTIVLMTSNYRISDLAELDDADPSAFLARLFEVEASRGANWSAKASKTLREGTQAWGHAGVEYIVFLQRNRNRLQTILDYYAAKLSTVVTNYAGIPRYHVAFFTAVLTGAQLAKRAGIVDFDLKALEIYALTQLSMRAQDTGVARESFVASFDPVDLFSAWVMRERARWVVTTAASPRVMGAKWFEPERAPVFHVDVARREVIVRVIDVAEWIKTVPITAAELRRKLSHMKNGSQLRTFAAGTTLAAERQRCVVATFAELRIDAAADGFVKLPPVGYGTPATHAERKTP